MALVYSSILNVVLTLQHNTKGNYRQVLQAINNATNASSPGRVQTLTFASGPVTLPQVAGQTYFVFAPQANSNLTLTVKQFITDTGFQVDANRPFFLSAGASPIYLAFSLPITFTAWFI